MNERLWYYSISGRQEGPVTEDVLVQMFQSRRLSEDTMVWTEELKDWVRASSVEGVLPSSPNAPSPPPPPLTAQAINTHTSYAGFWRRFVAILIDTVVLMVLGGVGGGLVGAVIVVGAVIGGVMGASGSDMDSISAVAGVVGYVIGIVLNWLYFTLFESSQKQATLGKMALGIMVTDVNGDRITFGRANGRYWSKIVSALILLVGYLMAAFTEKKQALHDMMSGCLVVQK